MSKFNFGTPAQPGTSGGFNFGTNNSPQLGGFGTPAAQPATNLSFGQTAPAAAPAAAPTGFGFGAQTTATGGFGTTSTLLPKPAATQFGFGTATSSTAPALSFSTTTTSSTGAPQFNFNANQQNSLLGAKPLSFGTTTTSQGIFNTQPTLTPAAPVAAPVGLGGVDINATQPKSVEGKNDGTKVKESQLPQEIISTVEAMKGYIKQQKTVSSDIARTSQRQLNHVATEIQNLYSVLSEISNSVESNYAAIKALRSETGQAIHHAEMAQRTHETPAGLQFENSAPLLYFMELVQKYENEMILFRNQVEMTEKHMKSLASPQSFSADDLKRGLQQIHESFIALAGRHHEIHQKVEAQKEVYLNLRRYYLHDKTNVFEVEESTEKSNYNKLTMGPTPFSTMSTLNLGVSLQIPSQTQNQPTGASPFGTTTAFGTANTTLNTNFSNTATDSSFNLQKPPPGSKRNKQSFF